jgi:asparagine synthase (glutamine-hydrolysing)
MCGILGGVSLQLHEARRIEEALNTIRHRGPDDSGIFIDENAFLGARRLAIIDTVGGHQPISNEDQTITVALNGEIYNYRELGATLRQAGHKFRTQSDTETLVHAYEEWGEEFVRKLRGMYAFAIWDKRRGQMFLARDRFGKKPLYYTCIPDGSIYFASEIKALRPFAAQPWTIRDQSIYDYLSLCVVPQPYTVYNEVKMLPEASIGIFKSGSLQIRKYWQLSPRMTSSHLSYEEALEQVRCGVREAVKIRLRSDVPLGVFLSSGIDSSVVAYEAAQELGSSLQTFTIEVADQELNEAPLAQETARRLGVKNQVIRLNLNPLDLLEKVVPHFDQPFADASAIPTYAVSSRAREFVTVALNGDGGDELFGGYRRYVAAALSDRIPFLKVLSRFGPEKLPRIGDWNRRGIAGFMDRLLRGASKPPGERYLIWTTDTLFEREKRPIWRGGPVRPTEEWIGHLLDEPASALRVQMNGDRQIILPELLMKMDMASMLASLEARSPLLDHELAELAAGFPDEFLVRGIRAKAVLRDAYRGVLPPEIIKAKKRGFEIPLGRWLDNELKSMIHDLVAAPDARVASYLDRNFLKEILRNEHHRERNRSYILYSLLVLELWLRSIERVEQPMLVAAA